MPLNTSRNAIIDERRRHVANLRLRGATQREIVDTLERNGVRNPATGKPYSLGIINSDLKALESEWKEEAAADIAEHKSKEYAEIQELKRAAWKAGNLAEVRQCLALEIKLLGTEAAARSEMTIDDTGLSDDERANRIVAIFDAARARRDRSHSGDGDS